MAVTLRALRLQQQLEAELAKVTDQQVRDLTAAWVRAYDETAGDLQDAVQQIVADHETGGVVAKALVTRNRKLLASLAYIGHQLELLARDAGVRVLGDVRGVVQAAADAQTRIIGAQLPADLDLTGSVQAATIDTIVTRTATQITNQTYPLAADAYDAMRRELLRGIVVGANPRHTAKRIVDRAEGRFNGGLTRALTIARSETLDAHRAGAMAGEQAHGDVLTGWVWMTHLSPRTCPACIAMNGQVFPLSQPGPQGHPNCRCARCPITKSWAELGIRGMDEPEDVRPTPEKTRAWFDGLSHAEQLQIMGPDRLALLQSGAVSLEDLATLRHNQGWRPSWQITPLAVLRQNAAA